MDAQRFHLILAISPDVSVSLELNERCGLHAGIVYNNGTRLQKLHFAWHLYLVESVYEGIACAVPALDSADSMWIASYCGKIARNAANYRSVPYNLKYDE